MYEFATQMQTLTGIWIETGFTGNMKLRRSASHVLEVEQAIFTPLVFSSTGGMAAKCKRYHSKRAELLATKKGKATSWIRARVPFHC